LYFGILIPDQSVDRVGDDAKPGWIPIRIRLRDYPQLERLAWQIQGTDALEPRERDLIDALRRALGETAGPV
jgi:hypothetical protein